MTQQTPLHAPVSFQHTFSFFEQAKLCNQETVEETVLHNMQLRCQGIRQTLQKLAEFVRDKLAPLRDDLEIYVSPCHASKLPESLFFSLTRAQQDPTEDAQLYLLLQEEGAEIGFGFGLRGKRRGVSKIEQRFFDTLRRFHRKAERYIHNLQRHTYRLWPSPQQPQNMPSLSIAEWKKSGGVVVRLLNRELFLRETSSVEGMVTQVFGELIGLYGFLDRTYTDIPYIRTLGYTLPEEQEPIFIDDDLTEQHEALQDIALEFVRYASQEGFVLTLELARAYILSLQTKPFVILSGVAGTGKSQLAQLFARFLTEDAEEHGENPHIALLPVRPDWLDPHGILGYDDSLTGSYQATPFLRLLLRAHQDPENPYFAILDELNLARTEYYLSDILSLLESRRYGKEGELLEQAPLYLHHHTDPHHIEDLHAGLLEIPSSVPIPPNLYIIGTLNLDETTHRLSPKVLDRAQMIELEAPSPSSFLQWLTKQRSPSMARSPGRIANLRAAFSRDALFSAPIPPSQWSQPPESLAQLVALLDTFFLLFQQAGFGFGLRVVQESLLFAEHTCRMVGLSSFHLPWVIERILLQKFLPRLHGPKHQLEELLSRLLLLCWASWEEPETRERLITQTTSPEEVAKHLRYAHDEEASPAPAHFPQAARKIAKMIQKLQQDGYVDFHA